MRKNIFFMILISIGSLFSYELGNTVNDTSFKDIDFNDEGNTVLQRKFSDFIENGRPVVIYFEEITSA